MTDLTKINGKGIRALLLAARPGCCSHCHLAAKRHRIGDRHWRVYQNDGLRPVGEIWFEDDRWHAVVEIELRPTCRFDSEDLDAAIGWMAQRL